MDWNSIRPVEELPCRQLPVMGASAVITFVYQDNVNKFYLRFKEDDQIEQILQEKMKQIYDSTQVVPILARNLIKTGVICALRDGATQKWIRAQIIGIDLTRSLANCYYVDIGSTEWTSFNALRPLHPDLTRIPAMAAALIMSGNPQIPRTIFATSSSNIPASENRPLSAKSQPGNIANGSGFRNVVAPKISQAPAQNNLSQSLAPNPIQVEPLIPLPKISAGSAIPVRINEMHRLNCIGISIITENFLEDFERKLAENIPRKTAVPVEKWRAGCQYVMHYKKNYNVELFHRVRLSSLDHQNAKCEVELMDYASNLICYLNPQNEMKLYLLNREEAAEPARGLRCEIDGVNSLRFNSAAEERLWKENFQRLSAQVRESKQTVIAKFLTVNQIPIIELKLANRRFIDVVNSKMQEIPIPLQETTIPPIPRPETTILPISRPETTIPRQETTVPPISRQEIGVDSIPAIDARLQEQICDEYAPVESEDDENSQSPEIADRKGAARRRRKHVKREKGAGGESKGKGKPAFVREPKKSATDETKRFLNVFQPVFVSLNAVFSPNSFYVWTPRRLKMVAKINNILMKESANNSAVLQPSQWQVQ